MNINLCTIISLIYMMAEKWIPIGATNDAWPSGTVRSFSLEDRTAAVDEFKRYYPLLDEYWEMFGEHKEVMMSAVGCAKLAVVYPFLSPFRLLLLAIGYGVDADTIKAFMMTDGASKKAPNEFYQKIYEFNNLAKTVGQSSGETDIARVFESTDSVLSTAFTKFISGANQISKFTVNELGNSLKSCFDMFVKIKENKNLQQSFIDAIRNIASCPACFDSDSDDHDSNEPRISLGGEENLAWREPPPTVEFESKMRRIDFVCKDAGAPATPAYNRNRSLKQSSASSFGGNNQKEDDPFKGWTMTDLRNYDDDE